MYEKLAAVAPLMEKLSATLSAPDSNASAGAIMTALHQTASEISDAAQLAASADERSDLQTIYRGMLAAKRIVAQLHELPPA